MSTDEASPQPSPNESTNMAILKTVLERTLSEEHFGLEGTMQLAQELHEEATAIMDTRGDIESLESEHSRLTIDAEGLQAKACPAPERTKLTPEQIQRFRLDRKLGKGGTSEVFALQDANLGRTVALKALRPDMRNAPGLKQQFLNEARITAKLAHHGILPIHDLDVSHEGEPYFTMRMVEGQSLGEALRDLIAEKPSPAIEDLNDRVTVMIKVGEALAFAHHQDIIHQDIKPDNIMLGGFGEVLVVDWGTASESSDREAGRGKLVGTPAFMAPEQAKREVVGPRTDVYCFGATLFQLLFKRHPVIIINPGDFWVKKSLGKYDQPTASEKEGIPPQLQAIVDRCMAPKSSDRYPSMQAVVDDLKAFQSGQLVTAYKYNAFERFGRWYRRNRQTFTVAVAACFAVLLAGGAYWQERAKTTTDWTTLAEETFGTTSLAGFTQDWHDYFFEHYHPSTQTTIDKSSQAEWAIKRGSLHVAVSEGCANLVYKQALVGDARIGWDSTFALPNGNMSAFISGNNRFNAYTVHVGGWGEPRYVALSRAHPKNIVEYTYLDEALSPNRTYRFELERYGNRVTFSVDGKAVITYDDPVPLSGPPHQRAGIEIGIGSPQRIDNILVEHRPAPRLVSPLELPRTLVAEGNAQAAKKYYTQLKETYTGTAIAEKASYGLAIASIKDEPDVFRKALQRFRTEFPNSALTGHALVDECISLIDEGALEKAELIMQQVAKQGQGGTIQRRLFNHFSNHLVRIINPPFDHPRPQDMATNQRALDEIFPLVQSWSTQLGVPVKRNAALESCAEYLVDIGEYDRVIRDFPQQRKALAKAYAKQGELEKAAAVFNDGSKSHVRILLQQGKYSEVLELETGKTPYRLVALFELDQHDTIKSVYPKDSKFFKHYQHWLGQYDGPLEPLHMRPELIDAANRKTFRDGPHSAGPPSSKGLGPGFGEKPRHPPGHRPPPRHGFPPPHHAKHKGPEPGEGIKEFKSQAQSIADAFNSGDYTHALRRSSHGDENNLLARYALAMQAMAKQNSANHELAWSQWNACQQTAMITNWDDVYDARYIYGPILLHLRGDTEGARQALRANLTILARHTNQRFLPDAQYILGDIDKDTYLKAPFLNSRKQRAMRLPLMEALRYELAGAPKLAKSSYERFKASLTPYLPHDPVRAEWVAWRLAALE